MAKRIYNPKTQTYYATRERSTNAGNKGSIKGKWSPQSAQAKAGSKGAKKTVENYDKTLKWLGGNDR